MLANTLLYENMPKSCLNNALLVSGESSVHYCICIDEQAFQDHFGTVDSVREQFWKQMEPVGVSAIGCLPENRNSETHTPCISTGQQHSHLKAEPKGQPQMLGVKEYTNRHLLVFRAFLALKIPRMVGLGDIFVFLVFVFSRKKIIQALHV